MNNYYAACKKVKCGIFYAILQDLFVSIPEQKIFKDNELYIY